MTPTELTRTLVMALLGSLEEGLGKDEKTELLLMEADELIVDVDGGGSSSSSGGIGKIIPKSGPSIPDSCRFARLRILKCSKS